MLAQIFVACICVDYTIAKHSCDSCPIGSMRLVCLPAVSIQKWSKSNVGKYTNLYPICWVNIYIYLHDWCVSSLYPQQDPFHLTVEGDNLYGRGTTDCLGMFGGVGWGTKNPKKIVVYYNLGWTTPPRIPAANEGLVRDPLRDYNIIILVVTVTCQEENPNYNLQTKQF